MYMLMQYERHKTTNTFRRRALNASTKYIFTDGPSHSP